MTLERKCLLGVNCTCLLLALMLVVVSVSQSRVQLIAQMQTHALEKATAVAAGIAQLPRPLVETQIRALLEEAAVSPLFSHLSVRQTDGVWVEVKAIGEAGSGAPDWFKALVATQDVPGSALLRADTGVQGVVEAVVHAGGLVQPLWRLLLDFIAITAIVLIGENAVAFILLRRWLRPLRVLEQQAHELNVEQRALLEKLPAMPELEPVVIAVNRLVDKLKSNYDHQLALCIKLRREASVDATTGIANRREFDSRLASWLASEKGGSPGAMVLVHVAALSRYNDKYGREAGDSLLQQIASRLERELRLWPDGMFAKRSGSDFALFAPGLLQEEVGDYLANLCAEVAGLDFVASGAVAVSFGCAVSKSVTSTARMLSAADAALRLAKSSGEADWAVYPVDDPMLDIRPAGEWQAFLAMLIDQKQLLLHFQPVFGGERELLHNEVYSRVQDGASIVQAGVFWPLAERYGLVSQLDRQVVEKALGTLRDHASLRLSVNLSNTSLSNGDFMHWLRRQCEVAGDLAKRLTFEFNESVLLKERDSIKALSNLSEQFGCAIAIDHFGLHPAALGSLRSLRLGYVKVHRSYTSRIADNAENQFYLSTLVQIAHACDVRILADGIETELEWQFLRNLGVTGGQGYYLGQPAETPVDG